MKKPQLNNLPEFSVKDEDSVDRETPQPMIRCVVCGSDTQVGSAEHMCWVCRRLKISAWRDVEQQMPAQE